MLFGGFLVPKIGWKGAFYVWFEGWYTRALLLSVEG